MSVSPLGRGSPLSAGIGVDQIFRFVFPIGPLFDKSGILWSGIKGNLFGGISLSTWFPTGGSQTGVFSGLLKRPGFPGGMLLTRIAPSLKGTPFLGQIPLGFGGGSKRVSVWAQRGSVCFHPRGKTPGGWCSHQFLRVGNKCSLGFVGARSSFHTPRDQYIEWGPL